MKRVAKYSAAILVLLIGLVGTRIYWVKWGEDQYYSGKAALKHSWIARSVRCRSIDRPALASRTDWTMIYSWQGGFGPGDVLLELKADGSATLRSHPNDGEETQSTVKLTTDQVRKIGTVIDDSGILCIESVARDGYVVMDLGRFTVQVSAAHYSKLVYLDERTTVNDGRAFGEVLDAIFELAPVVGEQIRWGPYATSSIRRP